MSKVNFSRVKAGDLELKEKVVAINRVVKTTKGGRAFSFSASICAFIKACFFNSVAILLITATPFYALV